MFCWQVVAEITWAFVYVTDGSDERIGVSPNCFLLPVCFVCLSSTDILC